MNVSSSTDPAGFLRRSLRANGVFSTLSGLTFVVAAGAISEFLGAVPALLVAGVGGQLLLFAAALIWLASRSEISVSIATAVIAADLLWVIGTVGVVCADVFSRGGAALAILLADVVLLLAILQSIGVHRMSVASRQRQEHLKLSTSTKWALGALVGLPLIQWTAERLITLPIGPSRMLTIGLCAIALIPLVGAVLEYSAGTRLSRTASWVIAVVVPLLAIAHLLSFARFADGPFGPVPGGPFDTATAEAPADWSNAAKFRYVEMEVDSNSPRTLETVFLVHGDGLYVAANMPESKRWPHAVREQGNVRVRFERDQVYALEARYVESVERTQELQDALNTRYGFDLSMGGEIWFFALERRPES